MSTRLTHAEALAKIAELEERLHDADLNEDGLQHEIDSLRRETELLWRTVEIQRDRLNGTTVLTEDGLIAVVQQCLLHGDKGPWSDWFKQEVFALAAALGVKVVD